MGLCSHSPWHAGEGEPRRTRNVIMAQLWLTGQGCCGTEASAHSSGAAAMQGLSPGGEAGFEGGQVCFSPEGLTD